ncbi:unknown protein [Microcystis aeruginosa NIES-843]|uniref:Uncharacterized protein n=1 Tax=Microcystis aeruginosa (strain NIES-843 / IAM M-2473) TaxID=449447 RepID=B0JMY0_MICAN|nr:unknown protein [Microcystis aeruginosa NIES-843]
MWGSWLNSTSISLIFNYTCRLMCFFVTFKYFFCLSMVIIEQVKLFPNYFPN